MADKNQAVNQPPIKIGHYSLGETLGVGSFGKVKSKYLILLVFIHLTDILFSCRSSDDQPQSGCKNTESTKNQVPRCCWQNSP